MSSAPPPPLRFSPEQIRLLREVISNNAPDLVGLVDHIAKGGMLTVEQVDVVEDVLTAVMTSEGMTTGGEITPRGIEIDDLLGPLAKSTLSYYD